VDDGSIPSGARVLCEIEAGSGFGAAARLALARKSSLRFKDSAHKALMQQRNHAARGGSDR
jgi:hypothetical protein